MSGMSTVLGVMSSKFSMLLEKTGFGPLEGFLDSGKEDMHIMLESFLSNINLIHIPFQNNLRKSL